MSSINSKLLRLVPAFTIALALPLAVACSSATTVTDDDDGSGTDAGKTKKDGSTSTSPTGSEEEPGTDDSGTSSGGKDSGSGGNKDSGSNPGTDSGTGGTDSGSGGTDAGTDAGKDSGTDAGMDAGAAMCPITDPPITSTDMDDELTSEGITYTDAIDDFGSCSQADLTQFHNNLNDANITTFFGLKTGLSTTCQSCVFAKDTDAKWAPIVGTASNNGATGFVDWGACYGDVDTGGGMCGKAVQYSEFCVDIACSECTDGTTASDACPSASFDTNGFCSNLGADLNVYCDDLAGDDQACGTLEDAVAFLCGP